MERVDRVGASELAGHLKAELLAVRYDLQRRQITEAAARRRVELIRRRRMLAQEELMRMPAVEAGVLQAASN
jgi:hypothetical protein